MEGQIADHRILEIMAKKTMFAFAKKSHFPISEEEQEELNAWCSLSERNRNFFNRISNKAYVAKKMLGIYSIDKKGGWKKFERDYLLNVDNNGSVANNRKDLSLSATRVILLRLLHFVESVASILKKLLAK